MAYTNPRTWTVGALSANTVVQWFNEIRDNLRYFKGDDGQIDLDAPLTVDGPVRPGRYTTSGRNAIAAAEGMLLFNTTVDEHQGYVNGAWVDLRGSTPTGMVIDWNGGDSSIPDGFLECDDSAVSRTTYAALFAVISTTWGTGDGSTTFNLPDIDRSDSRIIAVIKT